jgi:hypothetical protein
MSWKSILTAAAIAVVAVAIANRVPVLANIVNPK